MKRLCFCASLVAMLVAVPYLFAQNYTMGYTPPGGVTLGQGGSDPTAGQALYDYSNFNSSAYQTLYYGVNYVLNVNQGGPGTNMAFQGYNSSTGILAWGSTANWTWSGTLCGYNGLTQFIAQIQPFTGTPGFVGPGSFLTGQSTTKSALGITNSGNPNDPLFQVVSGGSYQITYQYQTWDGTPSGIGNGQSLAGLYNGCQGGAAGQFFTSVDFEFWWSIPKTTAKTVQVGTCKTKLSNYATIQTAVNAVPSGATVEICPGTYSEQLHISAPITLEGIASGTNESVVLTPPGVFELSGTGPVSGYPIYAQILVQDAGPVNISGITVDGNNSGCPAGAIAGIAYLSAATASSGKIANSVIRNTGNGCGSPGVGIYGENGTGSASAVTVQGNSIHSINGGGIIFGPNMGGTITQNTISQSSGGLMFQQAGPNVKANSNNIISTQSAISLHSSTGVTAQDNTISNTSNDAISLQDNGGGGTNNVTKNTINEASCGISTSNASGTDVYFPNTVLNASATTCP